MPKLYELAAAYKQLEILIDEDVTNDTLHESLDAIEGVLVDKGKDVAAFIRNLEVEAEAIKYAEYQMSARRKSLENRIKGIRNYLLTNMLQAGIEKIECPLFKVSVCNNPPSVIVDDEKLIPSEYMRQPEPPPPSPDKKKILEDIKQGVIVDGCHIEQGKTLLIK